MTGVKCVFYFAFHGLTVVYCRYVLDGDREELRFIRTELSNLRQQSGHGVASSSVRTTSHCTGNYHVSVGEEESKGSTPHRYI